ncbi:hypothetical protein [Kitasatospora sp. MY 5-36]|uniref:hypothetical protein n=1 Tax=Kitasatospora sp. MY 5-36 TaxID=1678027 RepID=UPI0006711027|nr:hypothetical protein [Kitasatospora sp. MY 5-36]
MARTIVDAFLFDSTWGDSVVEPSGSGAVLPPPRHPFDGAQLAKILRDNLDGELTIIVDAKGNLRLR